MRTPAQIPAAVWSHALDIAVKEPREEFCVVDVLGADVADCYEAVGVEQVHVPLDDHEQILFENLTLGDALQLHEQSIRKTRQFITEVESGDMASTSEGCGYLDDPSADDAAYLAAANLVLADVMARLVQQNFSIRMCSPFLSQEK